MKNEAKVISIIQASMAKMETKGYRRSTLNKYRDMYRSLQLYCENIDADKYSEVIGKQFIEFVQRRNPTLSDVMYRQYRNCIRRLDCFLSDIEWEPLRRKSRDYTSSCYDNIIREYENYLVRKGKSIKRVHRLVKMAADFLGTIERFGCMQIDSISVELVLKCFEQATDKYGFREKLSIFFQYVYNHGMTKTNLRYIIPTVLQHHGVPSVYSPEEVEQLLGSIDRTTEIGKRDFAIILIAARLGLRASDIANLRFDSLEAEKIIIEQLKTKQPLTTALLDEVKEAIYDYADHGRPQSSDTHIFLNEGGYGSIEASSIYGLTRRAFMRSGIDCGTRKKGTHSLRASLATALLSEGNDYPTVQKVLGQLNIESTKSYAKADVEQLRTHAVPVPQPTGNFAALLSEGASIY